MPFRALRDGNIVAPASVPNHEPVVCLECGGTLYARGGEKRARHFYHVTESAGKTCPSTVSGESTTHARCVALAVEALQETFGSQADRCASEVEIDVTESGSGNRTRRVDALLEFTTANPVFGNGLIIEVQHNHHEKDVRMTTHDYLSAGYSVAWLSSEAFGEEKVDYSVVDDAFTSTDGHGYSVREYSPEQFLACESYRYSGEHTWGTVPSYVLTCEEDYEICTSRACTLRRQYNAETAEYVYDPAVTTPDLPIRVLQNTLVGEFTRGIETVLTERYHNAVLEKALADRPEIDPCPGPKGFHEWEAPDSHWGGYAKVELRACQHCPVHLLTDRRGYADERTDLFFSEKPDPEWNLPALKADPRQCQNPGHDEEDWYGYCPDCGVSNTK